MNDIDELQKDLRNSFELPADLERFKLISDADMSNLRPGCLIGWYYKDELDFWKGDDLKVPMDPSEMPHQGIGVLASGQEWRGGTMDTEDVVICQFTYPTEKCYPDGRWFTLHRLLNNPELACVAISRSAEPPAQGPMGPTVVVKTDGVPSWKA